MEPSIEEGQELAELAKTPDGALKYPNVLDYGKNRCQSCQMQPSPSIWICPLTAL